jgi:ABC-type nitrate/sulfonate/bicarbonate transport system substrate-binding protein
MKRWAVWPVRYWKVALLAASVLALAACGGSSSSGSETTSGGETTATTSAAVKSSITYGFNNPNYATQMLVYVAKAKGYFDDVGIKNVKVITTDNFVAGLIGGSLDISQGDTDQWLAAAQKSGKITYLSAFRASEWHILGVSKDIKKPSDLIGKKVTAGERGGRNEFVLKTMLKAVGVDPAKVDFVPLGGGSDARLQALVNGQVQGAVIFPRHEKELKRSGGQLLYKKLALVPQEGIATTKSFLAKNRATVVAFLTATIRARQYIEDISTKPEVMKIMRANDFDIPAEFESQYDKVEREQLSKDGGFDADQMDELVKEEEQLNLLPKGLVWRTYTDFGPLWDAQAALGLPKDPPPSAVQ